MWANGKPPRLGRGRWEFESLHLDHYIMEFDVAEIPSGYLFKMWLYECDGDNCQSVDIPGLTESQVQFNIDLVEYFGPKYGNEEVDYSIFVNDPEIKEIEEKYSNLFSAYNFVSNYIGTWCDEEYWRVFDYLKVFYVPEPLKEVTKEFKTDGVV